MASCVSPLPRFLAFLPVTMLCWRTSFFWRRKGRDEEATGEVKEWKTRKREYLTSSRGRRGEVASRTTIILTATVVVKGYKRVETRRSRGKETNRGEQKRKREEARRGRGEQERGRREVGSDYHITKSEFQHSSERLMCHVYIIIF